MSLIQLFLESNKNKKIKIAVIGDSMLDEYYNVKVKKISPEFPIPVMQSDTDASEKLPGGAANVAYQFKNFNVDIDLISFVDAEAKAILNGHGINTNNCLTITKNIPRKRRFYSDSFPTYRWDVEKPDYGYPARELERLCFILYANIKPKINQYDAVIFSDYNKGIFEFHTYNLVRDTNVGIVDPKYAHLDKWKNCLIFKPNASEALVLSGKDNIEDAGFYLLEYLNCKAVVITQGGDGISIFVDGKMFQIKPSSKLPPVESVIGAGDCAIAFLTMAIARGFDVISAANLAWQAGMMYVQNRYNKPISVLDLQNLDDASNAKILTKIDEQTFGNRNYRLVFTNGCFDILHAGHIENLKFAKKQGDKLIIAVNSDASIARLKPNRPIVNLNDRMKLLASLQFVDYVVAFDEDTPYEILKIIKPDVLVKGSEYGLHEIVGVDIVPEIITCPMYGGLSTTSLIEKIKDI